MCGSSRGTSKLIIPALTVRKSKKREALETMRGVGIPGSDAELEILLGHAGGVGTECVVSYIDIHGR
jgi:hypothetical protein